MGSALGLDAKPLGDAVGAVERRRGGVGHEGAHEGVVRLELAEKLSVKPGSVLAAVVRADGRGDHLFPELGERRRRAHGAVEVQVRMEQARVHAVGPVERDDPSEGAPDTLVGFLQKIVRALLIRRSGGRQGTETTRKYRSTLTTFDHGSILQSAVGL